MKVENIKKLQQIKLTDLEKRDLFGHILLKIGITPLNPKTNFPTPSPFYKFTFLLQMKYMKVGISTFLILLFSSTTVFASLGALPGDLLYGIKINITEKVPYFISFSSENRAKINSNNIDKRMLEFEKLADKGRLTKENTKTIENSIDQNLGRFDKNVQKIKQKNNNKIKNNLEVDLESKIKKHVEKLKKIEGGVGTPESGVFNPVLNRVSRPKENTDNSDGDRINEKNHRD